MGGNPLRHGTLVVIVSAGLVAGAQGCNPPVVKTPPGPRSAVDVRLLPGAHSWKREAAGGGYVTVNTAPTAGSVAVWDSPPAAPTVYAFLDNNGENNKREKRYDLKKKDEAYYEVVLSNDGSKRTMWELVEVAKHTLARRSHGRGHLWRCEEYHASTTRQVGFRDCTLPVEYNFGEIAVLKNPGAITSFASYVRPESEASAPETAAIWISCTTGCCTLGR